MRIEHVWCVVVTCMQWFSCCCKNSLIKSTENIGFPVFISLYLYNYWSHECEILSRLASFNCELYHMFFSQNILFIFKLSQTGLNSFHIIPKDGAFNSAFFDQFIDSSGQLLLRYGLINTLSRGYSPFLHDKLYLLCIYPLKGHSTSLNFYFCVSGQSRVRPFGLQMISLLWLLSLAYTPVSVWMAECHAAYHN